MRRTQEVLQAELDFQVTRSSRAIIDAGNELPRLAPWHVEGGTAAGGAVCHGAQSHLSAPLTECQW
jgi:hypothetical protein